MQWPMPSDLTNNQGYGIRPGPIAGGIEAPDADGHPMPRGQAGDDHFQATGEDGILLPVVRHCRVAFGDLQLVTARALQLGDMGDQLTLLVAAFNP